MSTGEYSNYSSDVSSSSSYSSFKDETIAAREPQASTSKKNEIKIKRPLNSFMVYAKAERAKIRKEYPNLHQASISAEIGVRWKRLDHSERQPYIEEAARLKAEHERLYPDYTYQPKRRANKKDRQKKNKSTKCKKYSEFNKLTQKSPVVTKVAIKLEQEESSDSFQESGGTLPDYQEYETEEYQEFEAALEKYEDSGDGPQEMEESGGGQQQFEDFVDRQQQFEESVDGQFAEHNATSSFASPSMTPPTSYIYGDFLNSSVFQIAPDESLLFFSSEESMSVGYGSDMPPAREDAATLESVVKSMEDPEFIIKEDVFLIQ